MLSSLKIKSYLLTALKILVVIELIGAVTEGIHTDNWARLGSDLVLAGIVYLLWDRIRNTVLRKKDEFRRRLEAPTGEIKLWDALVFSLLWSDEIYQGIPKDRTRLILISYTLIGLGVLAGFVEIGSGLLAVIISGGLVLGAVNLLAWVVSNERGEKESLQTELRLAHDVQVSLMPTEDPRVEGFDIAGRSLPAREVGGDHFAYTDHRDDGGLFGVSVFDVSGKGMQAAMSAVFTTGALSAECEGHRSPADVLTRLNRAVYAHTKRGQFVAFLLAMIDIRSRTVTFANAGQTKPLLLSGGTVQWLNGTGVHFPLGMVSGSRYEDHVVALKQGDLLLFMTDGFTEAMGPGQEQFGTERMEELVKSFDPGRLPAESIVDMTIQAVQGFMASAPQHDDMTMVAVRVL